MMPLLSRIISQTSPAPFLDAPITTGAIFVALTGAITYLYRARDRDRDSEIERLERTIEKQEREISRLRQEQ